MKPTFFKEASHIWKAISGDIKADKLNFDLEIHKKLLNVVLHQPQPTFSYPEEHRLICYHELIRSL